MINDDRMLNITDLGAGSARMNKNQRKVSEIARYSAISPKYGVLLSNMASEFGDPVITELGTSLGISTLYMALSCPLATINTIEGCPSVSEVARENFQAAGISNIIVHDGSFDDFLPFVLNENRRPGMVFIDGNHRREPLMKYFSFIAGLADEKTVIIIDDINYSSEMEEAWSDIKNSPKISVTVDIFRMGIVFFRKGISRSDFVIRY
jgi:predicted O-methyltransferase YrrM